MMPTKKKDNTKKSKKPVKNGDLLLEWQKEIEDRLKDIETLLIEFEVKVNKVASRMGL